MKLVYTIIFSLLFSIIGFSQQLKFIDKLLVQDSSIFYKQKIWIDLSFGPSLTLNPSRSDVYYFGPTIDFTFIDKHYRLLKIKSSYHQGVAFFENFAQCSAELNIMAGKIKVLRKKYTNEFYYGIGFIMGRKRDGIISDHNGDVRGFAVLLPSTIYGEKIFYILGLPLEYKIQWRILGLGIDANLNPYLPYLGLKWYMKIGSKYRK